MEVQRKLKAIPKWLWSMGSAWYGWFGGSSIAGLVGLGHAAGWWNPPRRAYAAIVILGFLISLYDAWFRQREAFEKERTRNSEPDIDGKILIALVRVIGETGHLDTSTPNCTISVKLRITNRTNVDTTLKDAEAQLETNGKRFVGYRFPIGEGQWHRGKGVTEVMTDLIDSVTYSNPIRYGLGTEGWLEFYFEGLALPDKDVLFNPKFFIIIVDELGNRHPIEVDDVLVRR